MPYGSRLFLRFNLISDKLSGKNFYLPTLIKKLVQYFLHLFVNCEMATRIVGNLSRGCRWVFCLLRHLDIELLSLRLVGAGGARIHVLTMPRAISALPEHLLFQCEAQANRTNRSIWGSFGNRPTLVIYLVCTSSVSVNWLPDTQCHSAATLVIS